MRIFFPTRYLMPLVACLFAGCAASRVLNAPLPPLSATRSPDFRQAMSSVLGGAQLSGNRVTTLVNGDQIFPAMLREIRAARKTITFETFVFEKGAVPGAFAEAFAERARAGVKVHLLLDAHGAKKSRGYHAMLKESGVQLVKFHEIWYPDFRRFNNRTHRKLLVVDGKVGFIGGVGIADQWAGNAESPAHWRDCHYRMEGPVVAQLQAAFVDNWLKARHEVLFGPDYFPSLQAVGSVSGNVFVSSPRGGDYGVPLLYHLAIASARKTLRVENAYFVPDRETVEGLVAAAQRGVHVQIIVPGRHIDQKAVRRASRKRWTQLLEAGIEIYEYAPTMIHSKLLIVDDLFVSVGSANFDNRSLRLNDEANFNATNSAFAAEQTRIFIRDLASSERVTLENLRSKWLVEKPVQAVQTPVESQL